MVTLEQQGGDGPGVEQGHQGRRCKRASSQTLISLQFPSSRYANNTVKLGGWCQQQQQRQQQTTVPVAQYNVLQLRLRFPVPVCLYIYLSDPQSSFVKRTPVPTLSRLPLWASFTFPSAVVLYLFLLPPSSPPKVGPVIPSNRHLGLPPEPSILPPIHVVSRDAASDKSNLILPSFDANISSKTRKGTTTARTLDRIVGHPAVSATCGDSTFDSTADQPTSPIDLAIRDILKIAPSQHEAIDPVRQEARRKEGEEKDDFQFQTQRLGLAWTWPVPSPPEPADSACVCTQLQLVVPERTPSQPVIIPYRVLDNNPTIPSAHRFHITITTRSFPDRQVQSLCIQKVFDPTTLTSIRIGTADRPAHATKAEKAPNRFASAQHNGSTAQLASRSFASASSFFVFSP
ncbi:hypothetical protein SODALDRAFT_354617 [Sodiomyces alkalinus F11]|uniref:Uncharacterized protein n=1 Tax=Sodiomyces alkalinus (strain CBS 110278 / VKM F-3762 / F11) TaxID=1314773 RepID=A0A3N2Q6S2_SODAK|nr:hypothetical protein SODALDRAFT_354617 [Sodiomyces alkalinus F11]ROT42464.1 hypothetical protein SODALDRAFT_354617 [Sodiomyces alkalinus F11]